MQRWANEAQAAPSALLQQLAALARQDELRFEVDSKSTLTFQVVLHTMMTSALAASITHQVQGESSSTPTFSNHQIMLT